MTSENSNKREGHPIRDPALETRTTAPDGHSGVDPCRRCGEPVRGRRRNGWCSDRCRMRDYRERRAARVNDLITTVEQSVAALRVELEDHHEAS